MCVYELDADESQHSDGDGRYAGEFLRLVGHGGRSDPPRSTFTNADDHGKAALSNTKSRVPRCVEKPESAGFSVERDPDALWHSFILVPLHVDGKPRGMVTIDTPERTAFTDDHVAVAMTLARFIEIGMKNLSAAADETASEVRAAIDRLNRRSSSVGGAASQRQRREVPSEVKEGGDHGSDQ